jgi:hypothetical protein
MSEVETSTTSETSASEAVGKAGTQVKEGIVGSLNGSNEIEAEIVTLVRSTVSNTLKASQAVANESIMSPKT